MAKYRVLEAFDRDGTNHKVGETVELTEDEAASLVDKGNIEKVEA